MDNGCSVTPRPCSCCLSSTVRELRMAGVGPDQLVPAAFSSPAKHAELLSAVRRPGKLTTGRFEVGRVSGQQGEASIRD